MLPPLLILIILAVVQGITEFLPVSSDGHLVVVAALLEPSGDPSKFDLFHISMVLHAGTLGSIIVYYFYRLLRLLGEDWRVIGLLVVGTIPAVLIGLPMKMYAKHLLESPLLAGFGLIVTGLVLLWASRQEQGDAEYQELSWWQAALIGLAQATALLPGVSRSGTTISSGLGLGLKPQAAATFSFLLAVPVIAGACILDLKDMLKAKTTEPAAASARDVSADTITLDNLPAPYLFLGAAISFVVGLAALAILAQVLESGQLYWFAAWCIPLGIAVVIWRLNG